MADSGGDNEGDRDGEGRWRECEEQRVWSQELGVGSRELGVLPSGMSLRLHSLSWERIIHLVFLITCYYWLLSDEESTPPICGGDL